MTSLPTSFDPGLLQSMGELNVNRIPAEGSVQRPGQDAKFGRPTCTKGRAVTGIQCDTCDKWFHCACAGVWKGIYELCCQRDKLSWVGATCKKIARSAIQGKTQIGQRQTLSQVDGSVVFELGDNGSNGLPKDAKVKENNSFGREEGVPKSTVKEEPTSKFSADQMGPQTKDTPEKISVNGIKTKVLSPGKTEAGGKSKTDVDERGL